MRAAPLRLLYVCASEAAVDGADNGACATRGSSKPEERVEAEDGTNAPGATHHLHGTRPLYIVLVVNFGDTCPRPVGRRDDPLLFDRSPPRPLGGTDRP